MTNKMMNKPKKLAVAGLPGSGKSTVAKLISKHYGYSFHSFGNGIRQCYKDVFEPVLNRQIDKVKDRRLLQYIGKYARTFNECDKTLDLKFEKEFVKLNQAKLTLFCDMQDWIYDRTVDLGFDVNSESEIFTDFWIRYTFNQATNDEFVVIDDCRWWHEFDKLKAEGYTIVRLNVSKETAEKRLTERDGGFDPKTWDSAGETQCLEFPVDFEIDAEQTLGEVEAEVISKLFGV